MAVKDRIHLTHSGIPQQGTQIGFNAVLMAVGHIEIHSAYPVNKNLRLAGTAAVTVAVSGNHIEPKAGIFFLHGLRIVKMVTQMDHRIRLHRLDTPPHKA